MPPSPSGCFSSAHFVELRARFLAGFPTNSAGHAACCVCPRTLLPFANVGSTLLNRFQRWLQQSQCFRPGERVGVAVSGGADSLALLLLLRELQKPLGIVLSVVHFNHKIRGRASDTDERAVMSLAGKLNLPFHIGRE